jgi:hypothetical protein
MDAAAMQLQQHGCGNMQFGSGTGGTGGTDAVPAPMRRFAVPAG